MRTCALQTVPAELARRRAQDSLRCRPRQQSAARAFPARGRCCAGHWLPVSRRRCAFCSVDSVDLRSLRMLRAGAAASGDAGAAAAPPAPAVPWLLVGRRVRRAFVPAPGADLRLYDGVIVAVRTRPSAGTLWRVHYDEDGASEDLSWPELSAALVDEAGGPAGGLAVGLAPAATPSTPVVTPTPSAAADGGLVEVSAGIEVDSSVRLGSALPGFNTGAGKTATLPCAGQAPARLDSDTSHAALKFRGVREHPQSKKFFAVGPFDVYIPLKFATAQGAACAYDAHVRKSGGLVVNFPRPGTDEVQAIPGLSDVLTLQRPLRSFKPPSVSRRESTPSVVLPQLKRLLAPTTQKCVSMVDVLSTFRSLALLKCGPFMEKPIPSLCNGLDFP